MVKFSSLAERFIDRDVMDTRNAETSGDAMPD